MIESENSNENQIAQDIVKLISRGKEPDELDNYPALKKFITENPHASTLIEELSKPESYTNISENKSQDIEHLISKLNRNSRARKLRKLRLAAITTAAAACLVGGLFLWQHNQPAIQDDIQETLGQNHMPIIITDNGQQIVLSENTKHIDLTNSADSTQIGDKTPTGSDVQTMNTIIIPEQNTFSIKLSDGTEVTLNAESSLKYPTQFNTKERTVELTGEAYFKVTKSTTPFTIKMGDGQIRVYGTEFNANHVAGRQIDVILVNGSIGFKTATQEVIVKPKEKCSYSVNDKSINVTPVNISEYTCWLRNEFDYENIAITDLFDKISDWYGVTFVYNREVLKNTSVYISASRDLPLKELLPLLEHCVKLNFDVKSKIIYVKPK